MPGARVAFISAGCSTIWGGSEELWAQTAERLIKQGHKVAASVQWWPELAAPIVQLRRNGCEIHLRRDPTFLERLGSRIRRVHPNPVRTWLSAYNPDFVVISDGCLYAASYLAENCLALGLPYVLIAQSASESWWPDDKLADRIKQVYMGARRCFFVSQANRVLLETMLAIDLPHASVVRNPFNVAYDAMPPWPEECNPLRLACVGRLEPISKGQDLLFEVMALQKWRNRPITVSLYGGGMSSAGVAALRAKMHLDNVEIVGIVNDIEAVWRTHHALVLPSRYEGLPLALVEAMLCGRQSIVTDVAGHCELVDDNITGFVAAAPTVRALDEAMERAWARRDEWKSIGTAAREAVRERVPRDPIEAFIQQLHQIFDFD